MDFMQCAFVHLLSQGWFAQQEENLILFFYTMSKLSADV